MIKIIEKAVADLVPYENNARINGQAVDAVANSIREFGFKNPIIIDKGNVIIAGHTRLLAAIRLGIDKVPCIIADDLSDEQIKAFRIADNSTAQLADWDLEKLNAELADIDMDMSLFGLDEQMKEIEKEFDLLDDIDDSGNHSNVNDKVLVIDGNKVLMTNEETEQLIEVLNNYIDKNGVSFGFVRWLLNDYNR